MVEVKHDSTVNTVAKRNHAANPTVQKQENHSKRGQVGTDLDDGVAHLSHYRNILATAAIQVPLVWI